MGNFARVLLSALLLLLAPTAPALAQSAILCSCYCGKNILPPCSEQACKDACGWSSGGQSGGGTTRPAQVWYCRALARNGAAGWAWNPDQGEARQRALGQCQSRGRGCAIEVCRINDPSLAQTPRGGARSTAQRPRPAPTAAQEGWCGLCIRKLQSDIALREASGMVRIYVGQAIAGYENCKLKARGACVAGDQIVNSLKNCGSKTFSAYRACISDSLR